MANFPGCILCIFVRVAALCEHGGFSGTSIPSFLLIVPRAPAKPSATRETIRGGRRSPFARTLSPQIIVRLSFGNKMRVYRCRNHMDIGISGLVVEYIVAIDVTRVRFPADAIAWPRMGTAQLGRGQGHMAAKLTTCTGEQYVSSAPCSPSAFAVLLCFVQAHMQHSAPSARTA